MKKRLMGAVLGLALLCVPNIVIAASSCSYSEQAELNEIAANVKTNYESTEISSGTAIDPDAVFPIEEEIKAPALKINIMNITNDVNVVVTNNINDTELSFSSANTSNGVASFILEDVTASVSYTIDIYSNKQACPGELIRKLYIVTPIYNAYSEMAVCDENPDFYYCQEYLTTDAVTYEVFTRNLEEYLSKEKKEEIKKEDKTFIDKLKDFYNNHNVIINTFGVIAVIGGGTAIVITVKKRRSRVL